MASNRYVNNTISELEEINQTPVFDYEHSPLLSLEKALELIIPSDSGILNYIENAKNNCNRSSNLLTHDESAAIYLYSMPSPVFYSKLNIALRDNNNRQALEPWYPYLKLFITALKKLDSYKDIVWRGINIDDTLSFVDDDVHIWWSFNSCSKAINIVEPFLGTKGIVFAIHSIYGKDITEFSSNPDEQEVILMPGTCVRRRFESLNLFDRVFVLHLEEVYSPKIEANYLIETLKQTYLRNSRIEYLMNPAKSFPIDESYIHLAMVTIKEQHKKEQQLKDTENILNSYEEIYGTKSSIDVKDIFQSCQGEKTKQILVFGRAGIGKSTFCRYVTYQWAKGLLWPEYELVVLIPLRCLTEDRYPSDKEHTLFDLIKKEMFLYDLSEKEETLFQKQFHINKTLWILDGYDEIIQNLPKHLEYLLEQLLQTPYHILTSRPYMNTLSYNVQMEITGFTDDNITKYIEQFFHQLDDVLVQSEKLLLKFLKSNLSIWGIAHIPVNLELICSLWSNADWSEIKEMTITSLYTMITEWLCRRYLKSTQTLFEHEIYERCESEIRFLESLAFNAMKSNTIIIRPTLLKKSFNEINISSKIFNFGMLKSFQKQGVGTQIEVNKDYYFLHLSFQEYFAARYIINTLKGVSCEDMIEFIKYQKYNPRYTLVFIFATGLLGDIFWKIILEEPFDLIGLRHIELVILCLEEISTRSKLLTWIANCIQQNLLMKNKIILEHLSQSLRRTQTVVCEETIINMFTTLLQQNQSDIKTEVLSFICSLNISNAPISLINSIAQLLNDVDDQVQMYACEAVKTIGQKALTIEILNKLVGLLEHKKHNVATSASYTLRNVEVDEKLMTPEMIEYFVNKIGYENFSAPRQTSIILDEHIEKIATNEILNKLIDALTGPNANFRRNVYHYVVTKADKLFTTDMTNKLANLLDDKRIDVRSNACQILAAIGKKIESLEVINKLINIMLKDSDYSVRIHAGSVLCNINERIMTIQILPQLLDTLRHTDSEAKKSACIVLDRLGQRAHTEEVISALKHVKQDENEMVSERASGILIKMRDETEISEHVNRLSNAFKDTDETVRANVCIAIQEIIRRVPTRTEELVIMLENALQDSSAPVRYNACDTLLLLSTYQTNVLVSMMDIVIKLTDDDSENVRIKACEVIARMGERVATSEAINKILSLLEDESPKVKIAACKTLEQMGEKATTTKVIKKVIDMLKDENEYVREKACSILEQWSDKVTISKAIIYLVDALADRNQRVGESACRTLAKMIRQVFKCKIIKKLMNAIEDERDCVRVNACFILGHMEKSEATTEIISKIINLFNDRNPIVRRQAFATVARLSEKVVLTEVIDKIVSALIGDDYGIKMSAWDLLKKFNGKIKTGQLIGKLIAAISKDDRMTSKDIAEFIGNNLTSSTSISELGVNHLLEICMSKFASICFKNISEQQLIPLFLTDKTSNWASAIFNLAVVRKTAIIIAKEKFILYDGRTEPQELSISELEREHLVHIFNAQKQCFHLFFCTLYE